MAIPDFTTDGVLPAVDYPMTLNELRGSMLVRGRPGVTVAAWDSSWRAKLVENAAVLIEQLWNVGIDDVFIDGSFVENKARPGDIDGYFECPWEKKVSGDLERDLNLLDPHAIWTWNKDDRQDYAGKSRLPMWIHYRTELYPHLVGWPLPQLTGIIDQHGNELEFPSAFRQSRAFSQKGIVRILKG